MKNILIAGCFLALAAKSSRADLTNEQTSPVSPASAADTRRGLFNWLDSRSEYGQGVFPEPFLVDDSDFEPGEVRLDWLHTQNGGSKNDLVKAEIEKGFGPVTLELEVPYEIAAGAGATTRGFDNISLGARVPLFQYVSRERFVDSTSGLGFEAGIPTGSDFSKNAELVPKVFNDLMIGNFTAQTVLGYSALLGPGDDGGVHTFEYGFVFGYTIPRRTLPLPDVQELIPFLELKGETQLNKDLSGHNILLGNAGFRFNLNAIGPIQPRPGIGFVFPMDSGAREETNWGVIVSLVFQF